MNFAIKRQVAGNFDEIVAKTIEALKGEGFGILTDIDLQATLREKLGAEIPRYRILGACNPPLARAAIEAEPSIGVMLPCNVIVRESGRGEIEVAAVNPEAVMGGVGNSALAPISSQVAERLRRVIGSIAGARQASDTTGS